ncbi:hypothetical protein HMPREF1544_05673 [Mucor circinelloides 1006PhL]|uniref:C2H2-type domain-containing protein n=1 Tax=Mucor circinelloides f. circinelloides (strain 1006PhL) TaxID=1220926 RepID=S2JCG9_MUCC1|nr:hypothetical protein HMPREF1544_05673 [Mucor circinelloides 1006PhL]
MRMLDTDAETKTLTHIIRVSDTLNKRNLTNNHRDNRLNPTTINYLKQNVVVEEEEVDIEGLHESSTDDDSIIDVEKIDDEKDQQTEATPKSNQDDLIQSVAALQVAGDHQRKDDKVEKPTASDLDIDEPPLSPPPPTTKEAKAMPASTQKVDTAKPVVNAQSIATTSTVNVSNGSDINHQHQCHLCVESRPDFFQLTLHYHSAHNLTIPTIARFPQLQPDPDNINNYCQMCDRHYKHRATYLAHLKKMHRMSVSKARPVLIPQTAPKIPLLAALIENIGTKVLLFDSEAYNKSRSATPSLTPPSSNAAPAAPSDEQNNIPTIPANESQNNTTLSASSSTTETETATPTSTVQNEDAALKFARKDSLATGTVSSAPSSPTAPITSKQQSLVAIAPSSEIAPYPDLQDPNYYCKCCNRTLSTRTLYLRHCRQMHDLPLPDPDDPNFFCKVCNMKSPDLFTYRKHLGEFHQMKKFPEMVDIDCYHCQKTYANEKSYGAHLRNVAKKEKELQLFEERPSPIWDDPNFHCRKCLKRFEADYRYKAHLRSVHGMSVKSFKENNSVQNDGDHSDKIMNTGEDAIKDHFFCFACRKEYFDKLKYHRHLKEVHTLDLDDAVIDTLRIASSPRMFAKPLDPTLYYFIMKGIGLVHSG